VVIALFTAAGFISSDDIDIYLFLNLLKTVQNTISTKCGSLTDSNCQKSVKQVLCHNSVDLQKCQLKALVILATYVVVFMSIVIPLLYKDKAIPVPIHIPAVQLSQMTAAASATAITIATESNQPYITITQTPKLTTLTGYVDILIQFRCLSY